MCMFSIIVSFESLNTNIESFDCCIKCIFFTRTLNMVIMYHTGVGKQMLSIIFLHYLCAINGCVGFSSCCGNFCVTWNLFFIESSQKPAINPFFLWISNYFCFCIFIFFKICSKSIYWMIIIWVQRLCNFQYEYIIS